MKTKTVNLPEELHARMIECMAKTKIFNASEFIRLSVDSAVERVEKKYGLGAYAEKQKPEPVLDLSDLDTAEPVSLDPKAEESDS